MKIRKKALGIGLDIGSSTIKLVKLKFLRDRFELFDFSIEPVQTNLVETLKNIKEAKGLESVNIGVSGPSTVIRYINLPKMNASELKQALRFEAQKHIPFSMEEVNLDGVILQDDLPENKMLVLLVAVKKELINQRLKLIQDANLSANIIDVDSLALVNAFNFNYSRDDTLKNKAITLLNIGASITNLSILENTVPRLSRDIHIAGNNFTQKLVDTLGIDFKSAEELKLNPVRNITQPPQNGKISNGVNPTQNIPPASQNGKISNQVSPDAQKSVKITETFESVVTSLTGEIRISFDYYESQSASSVAKIFVSGAGSRIIGLKDMLANFLGIEVEYWDPLKQISLSSNIDPEKIKTLFSHLAVAVGLALRT